MIPANVQHGKYCPELAVTLCRASLDAYAGPEYTTALCHQWQAADAKLITAGDTEALLLIYPDCAILAFRGTSSGADVKTDLSATRAVLPRRTRYFLGKFACKEGQRGGEFYTPRAIVRLLVEMIEPYKGRVYDPCCG